MDRPNILFITSDQHRADCLGSAGHSCLETPHLDRLAFQGIRFHQCHSGCPLCIPARTSMITGREAHTNGIPTFGSGRIVERERSKFLGSLLTAAGYQTELIGKTHWHTPPGFRAGFEHMVTGGHLADARRRQMHTPNLRQTGLGFNEIQPGMTRFPPELYSTNWLVDQGVDFIRHRDKTQPFFLWLSLLDPHPPFEIHEPYYSMYDGADIPGPLEPDWAKDEGCPLALYEHRHMFNPGPMKPERLRKARSVYYGMITNLDHQLGRLFGTMMRENVWENTWVVYTSDHGEHLGDYGDIHKATFLAPSARTPFIVRPPLGDGFPPGRETDALIQQADYLPTFCEIADVEPPDDIDGLSILPAVRNESAQLREHLHGHIDEQHMVHDGRYKYIYFTEDGSELLFDTKDDPMDTRNLATGSDHTKRLRGILENRLREIEHEHYVDGKLLNRHRTKRPIAELRACDVDGLPPASD